MKRPCPYCEDGNMVKNGHLDGKQRFSCNKCGKHLSWSHEKYIEWVDLPLETPERRVVIQEELSELKREFKESRREQGFREQLLVAIKGAAKTFRPPPIPKKKYKIDNERTETRLILGLSDHHANRVITPESIEGLNEYNMDIYARRLHSVIQGVISLAEHQYTAGNQIQGLSINLLGDIGNDSQRRSNVSTNQMAENIASLSTGQIIAQAIDILLHAEHNGEYLFPIIQVRGVVGNEPRFDKKVNHTEPWRNWDYVIYQWISACLNSERIGYSIPMSPKMIAEELGWKFLLSHGHEIRGWAGVPYYGMARANAREQLLRKSRGGFDYHMSGHIHTANKLSEGCRGHHTVASLCGVDGYAHNGLAVSGEPSQTLLAVTEKRGVIGDHTVYTDDTLESPFIYDPKLASKGALRAMEEWRLGR